MADTKENVERLENKVDKISDDIVDIKVTLAENTASLKEHMRRSLANEEALAVLKSEVKPIEEHVMFVNKSIKAMINLVKVVGGVLTILATAKALGLLF